MSSITQDALQIGRLRSGGQQSQQYNNNNIVHCHAVHIGR